MDLCKPGQNRNTTPQSPELHHDPQISNHSAPSRPPGTCTTTQTSFSHSTMTPAIRIAEPAPNNTVPPRTARRINLSSASTRARPPSGIPQLVRSQTGHLQYVAPLRVRLKTSLRRLVHNVKKMLGRKKPAPTPEEAQCPCWHYPPDGWRFCRYDEHVADGIGGIAAREAAMAWYVGVLAYCPVGSC